MRFDFIVEAEKDTDKMDILKNLTDMIRIILEQQQYDLVIGE